MTKRDSQRQSSSNFSYSQVCRNKPTNYDDGFYLFKQTVLDIFLQEVAMVVVEDLEQDREDQVVLDQVVPVL